MIETTFDPDKARCLICSAQLPAGDIARFGNCCKFCAATLPEDTESIIDDLSESEKTQRQPARRQ